MSRPARRPTPYPSTRGLTWARAALAATALLLPAALAAQRGTVDPGMTRAQVEQRLGRPKAVSTAGEHSYLFFANGCVRTCGMDDLVVLRNDTVVDAVFRSPARRYAGVSSSPAALTPRRGRGGGIARAVTDSTRPTPARGGVVPAGAPGAGAPRPAAARVPVQGATPNPADSAADRRPVTIPGQTGAPPASLPRP